MALCTGAWRLHYLVILPQPPPHHPPPPVPPPPLQEIERKGADASCKSLFVLALLDQLAANGHRTLIFSQSRVMLDILEVWEESQGRGGKGIGKHGDGRRCAVGSHAQGSIDPLQCSSVPKAVYVCMLVAWPNLHASASIHRPASVRVAWRSAASTAPC